MDRDQSINEIVARVKKLLNLVNERLGVRFTPVRPFSLLISRLLTYYN